MTGTKQDYKYDLELVMPVYNEADSIYETLEEWHTELSHRIKFRFAISEDGSKDNTKEVLREAVKTLPILMDLAEKRRGYASAVLAAMRLTDAPFILAVDSDGQCDPKDFWQFWEARENYDVLIGWRINRMDFFYRKIMSNSFKLLHRILFEVYLHDPSCPYVLIHRHVLDRLTPELGLCPEGFWWEFIGWCSRVGFTVKELPIEHRVRLQGKTAVFRPSRLPRIALKNSFGLLKASWRSLGARH